MRWTCILLAAAGCVFGFAVSGEEIAKHKQWMDDAQDLKEEIREALHSSLPSQGAERATLLIALCEREIRFWKQAEVAEAQKLAESNLTSVRALERAAQANDLASARKAFTEVENGCRTCHDLHFEKQLAGKGGA